FGGGSSSGGVFVLVSDTWAYDFNTSTWTDMSPAIAPPARYNHAMAYDSESDRVILFGGSTYGNALFNDTWAYDFNTDTWNEVSPTSSPLARSLHLMAYDSDTSTWLDTTPVVEPPGRWGHALAYDSQSDRVILFGGGLYDTWAYDFNGNIWTDMAPASSPLGRDSPTLTYDSAADRVILFGGAAGSRVNYTEAWDYGSRARARAGMASTPPARSGAAMWFDYQ